MDLIFGIAGAVVGLIVGFVLFRRSGGSPEEVAGPEIEETDAVGAVAEVSAEASAREEAEESLAAADEDDGDPAVRIEELEGEVGRLREELRRSETERDRFRRWLEARFRRLTHELEEQWAAARLPRRVDELKARSRPPARHRVERIDASATQLVEWGAELGLSSAEAAHQLGLWHASQEKPKEAAECFQEAASRGMGVEAWLALGDCWWELGRREKAADAYGQCLKNDTMPPHAAWRTARVRAESRQPKEAMAALEPILGRDDLPVEVLVLAARTASRLGQDERAVEICEKGLASHPRSVELLAEMVVPLDRTGDRDRAEEKAEEAARLDGEVAAVPFALGRVHLAHGELSEAEDRFEDALEIDPEHPEALYHLGLVHHRQRRFRKALGAFKSAVEHRPDYAEAWYAMKDAYEGLKKFDQAIAALEKATKLDPDVA